MRFIKDWHWVVNHSWQVKILLLCAVLSGLEIVLPFFADDPPLPKFWFAVIVFTTIVAATVVRFVAQREDA